MKFKQKPDDEPVSFQIASMIDIVFLLLIFFKIFQLVMAVVKDHKD